MLRDLRYAVRVLLKSPAFALTAILTLSLCIGANTAIYTVVDRVLLRPLPYPDPGRLAQVIARFDRGGIAEGQTGGEWFALRDAAPPMDLAVFSDASAGVNLVASQQAEYVKQQRVGAGYFRTLGVPPALGREFTDAEDLEHGPPVAVLSHTLWLHLFGGDPHVVGKAVTLRGEPYTIVGVMPPAFHNIVPADI